MNDRFLHDHRRDPRPEFARSLRDRLREAEQPRRAWRPALAPALGLGGAAALVLAILTLPSVRASAQAMLDFFRVRKFAAVEFDESRMETLRSTEAKNALLVFDRREILTEPGPARPFATAAEAGTAAGFPVSAPSFLPEGLALDSVFVEGAGAGRVAVSEPRLRALLDRLDLRDVTIPAGIDGQWIEFRKPAVVIQRYRAGRWKAELAQAPSPEVAVPAGVDVERLAEVGLRILGLDAGEARRMAQVTDWRSTLVVPVPMNASTFRQVTVRGAPGLLITTAGVPAADGRRHRDGTVVMWTEGDRIYGLIGNLSAADAVLMAESVR